MMEYLFFILGALLLLLPSLLDMTFNACGLLGTVGFVCLIISLGIYLDER